MRTYFKSLNKINFSGPTNFGEILEMTIGKCEHEEREMNESYQAYSIVLIITDGVITDFQDTIDLVVNASDKPLSIIIVGVGNEDFS